MASPRNRRGTCREHRRSCYRASYPASLSRLCGIGILDRPRAHRQLQSRSRRLVCPGNAAICQDDSRLTTLNPNTPVNMICWIDARIPSGASTPRWFDITTGGVQGFVKAELVTNQQPGRPWCDDHRTQAVRAVAASLQLTGTAELYQIHPTATDKANAATYYSHTDADWGANDWSGDCVMWVALGPGFRRCESGMVSGFGA